jgi:hypothetical protein
MSALELLQYNLYMSDTLYGSDAMGNVTQMANEEMGAGSIMFKPMNDIQARLGKVLYDDRPSTHPSQKSATEAHHEVCLLSIQSALFSVSSNNASM